MLNNGSTACRGLLAVLNSFDHVILRSIATTNLLLLALPMILVMLLNKKSRSFAGAQDDSEEIDQDELSLVIFMYARPIH